MIKENWILIEAHLTENRIARTIMKESKVTPPDLINQIITAPRDVHCHFSWIPFENIMKGVAELETYDAKDVICIGTKIVNDDAVQAILMQNGGI